MPRLMPTYFVAYCWNKSPITQTKPPSISQNSTARALDEFVPERSCPTVADREQRHGDEFADGEKCDKRQRIHPGQIRLAVRDVHRPPQNACAESREHRRALALPGAA